MGDYGIGGLLSDVEGRRESQVPFHELPKRHPVLGNSVLAGHVKGAIQDLDADVRSSNRVDRFSNSPRNRTLVRPRVRVGCAHITILWLFRAFAKL